MDTLRAASSLRNGRKRSSTPRGRWYWGVLGLGVVGTAGCDITNPGNILDEDLNNPAGFEALVNGMASDFAEAFNGDNSGAVWLTGILFGDIWASSASITEVQMARGNVPSTRHDFANWSDENHAARWVAEDGVRRMREVLGPAAESNPLVAEALIWAGFANKMLGEIHCEAVFDGREAQPRSAFYERADQHFSDAIEVAAASGVQELLWAAYGGRASVRLILGDLDRAVQDAQIVPTDFEWVAHYNSTAQSDRQTNAVWHETHPRRNISVFMTWFWEYFQQTGDSRVPSADLNRIGADGKSQQWSEEKYADGTSDVPLAKGAEMRLIEAEGEIVNGQWEDGLVIINSLRAQAAVDPWAASTQQDAMRALIRERAIVTWLESKRSGEHYRLNNGHPLFPGGYEPSDDEIVQRMVELVGEHLDPSDASQVLLADRAVCFPFSDDIVNTNPNIS